MKLAAARPPVRMDGHRLLADPERAPLARPGRAARLRRLGLDDAVRRSRSRSINCGPLRHRPDRHDLPADRSTGVHLPELARPVRDAIRCARTRSRTRCPSSSTTARPTTRTGWFDKIASDPSYRIPVFNAGTLTDPLFTTVETLRMSNRIRAAVPGYPIQEYYGDYQHFVAEQGEGVGGHLRRRPPRLHGSPTTRRRRERRRRPISYRTGVTTRLNRFIDHYAKPAGNPDEPQPTVRRHGVAQICPQNAVSAVPRRTSRGRPSPRPASTELAPLHPAHRHDRHADRRANDSNGEPSCGIGDPFHNLLTNGGRCPIANTPAGPDVATYDERSARRAPRR